MHKESLEYCREELKRNPFVKERAGYREQEMRQLDSIFSETEKIEESKLAINKIADELGIKINAD